MLENTCFIVLTCDPAQPIITSQHANAIREETGGDAVSWLADGGACGIECAATPDETTAILAGLRQKYADTALDINCISADNRRKKLLVADMESTIIEQECLDELADLINIRPQIADITERAMRGEIEFEPALRERVALLTGLPEQTLQQIYDERVTLMPGAAVLIATMRAHGAVCALVSGGFSFYAEKVATALSFDHWRSNTLDITQGKLAGTVGMPILGRDAKAAFLAEWTQELKLDMSQTMAVGDGSNDLAMLAKAGAGVAFRAKPLVAEAAAFRITHGDLTGLLYLQGYPQTAFSS